MSGGNHEATGLATDAASEPASEPASESTSDPLVDRLRRDLALAVESARAAHRDTTRLIRLLTVIGQPSAPSKLVDDALRLLSELYACDVVCLARSDGLRLLVTAAFGLPEGDAAFDTAWPLAAGAARVLSSAQPAAMEPAGGDLDGFPGVMSQLGVRGGAWIPLTTEGGAGQLLILCRVGAEQFSRSDLEILASVASRLGLAIQVRQHSAAIERLAGESHRLMRRLELDAVLAEAVDVLRGMTDAVAARVILIQDGDADVRAGRGGFPDDQLGWPRPLTDLPAWCDGEASWVQERGAGGEYAVLSVPVLRDDVPLALLEVAHRAPYPLTRSTVELVTVFAGQLAATIANAALYRELRGSEASIRLITDSISDLVSVVGPDGCFVFASPSYRRQLGHDEAALIGVPVVDLVHPDDRSSVAAVLTGAGEVPAFEYRIVTAAGSWVWVESALRETADAGATMVLSSRLIAERKHLEDELRHRATHDALTGLANRTLSTQRLEAALGPAARAPVGLLFCDLDGFKAVNDRLGHDAGDDLLRQAAERLRSCVRPADLLARFGGDEFVVVLGEVGTAAGVVRVGRRIVASLGRPFPLQAGPVQVSVSVGGVLGLPGGEESAAALLRRADAAMYLAKAGGKNRVHLADEGAPAVDGGAASGS
jgi:diguanylate cyclase (GGDEF)-like protein/PAS domain S-box-containing protein